MKNLSSAAVVIGALRVKGLKDNHFNVIWNLLPVTPQNI